MERVFEPVPLLVAAAIGAAAFMIFLPPTTENRVGLGALTGAVVQLGVRLLGVS